MRSPRSFALKAAFALATIVFLAPAYPSIAGQGDDSPTKIAVFDFELVDHSAGAGIAGDRAADAKYLNAVSAEVRQAIEQSSRFRLVGTSGVETEAVRDHSLRNCNGCESKIASALGAEQSLSGTVTRVSRTEYVVAYQLRDAKSGKLIDAQDTGLRMGANYSWSRGASRLIKERLVDARPK